MPASLSADPSFGRWLEPEASTTAIIEAAAALAVRVNQPSG